VGLAVGGGLGGLRTARRGHRLDGIAERINIEGSAVGLADLRDKLKGRHSDLAQPRFIGLDNPDGELYAEFYELPELGLNHVKQIIRGLYGGADARFKFTLTLDLATEFRPRDKL
jgi:hypothetical protein